MIDSCGCCKGVEKLTPAVISNRPGLSVLSYRMGTHWSFLQTMKSRLSAGDYPELRGLSTREKDDFSMALMDAWAMVADILTFYQERIATEGYLRTAIERWSILELARLMGYRLRPGVASSTYLAFTLEKGYELEIPKGTRAQSLPDPGELPQSFETMEKIWASAEWSRLLPRTTIPTVITPNPTAAKIDQIYVQGLNHELKPEFPLVFDFGESAVARSIASVELQPEQNRTKINLKKLDSTTSRIESADLRSLKLDDVAKKSIPAGKSNQSAWKPKLEDFFAFGSDSFMQLFAIQQGLSVEDKYNFYSALSGDLLSKKPLLKSVRAFDLWGSVFGYNAPFEQIRDKNGLPVGIREWAIGGIRTIGIHIYPKKKERVTQEGKMPELEVEISAKNPIGQGIITIFPLAKGEYEVGDEIVNIKRNEINAWARFFHAYPDTGQANGQIDKVSIDGEKWLANLGLFKLSDYRPVPCPIGEVQKIKFMYCPPNIENTLELKSCKRYTLVAYMDGLDAKLKRFEDDAITATYNLRVIHIASTLNTLKIDGKQIDLGGELNLNLRTGEKNTLDVNSPNDNKPIIKIVLEPKNGKIYDCFLISKGSKLEGVISERPDPFGCSTVEFIFKSKSSDRETKMELIWDMLDSKDLSMTLLRNETLQFAKQLKNTGKWLESIQGDSIKIEYAKKFDLKIVEESSLPLPKDDIKRNTVLIDAPGSKIASDTWIVLDRPHETDADKNIRIFAQIDVGRPITETGYGIQAKVIPLKLRIPWYQQILNSNGLSADNRTISYKSPPEWLSDKDISLKVIRETAVYAENNKLELVDEPFSKPLKKDEALELDGLYRDLEPGRLLIISGERYDLPGARNSELAVLSGISHGKHKQDNGDDIESDTLHTFLKLAASLEYDYKRDTVTIFANVARASHGETREEILGSGDASKDFQEFYLRQSPLTYLAAPTPAGAESTLNIRVNGVLWHEKESLLQEGPRDHSFVTKTDNEDKTEAIFGDGVHAARLPSGVENVKAVYRTGIGKVGNVKANQITLLTSKPLGLKEVINPLPATGGADRDTIDQARRNIPLTAMSLDHLVSVKDYEDFAKTFAAIGKASATHLSDGRRKLVHVTISGKGNAPIDKTSDLYLNLVQALFRFGDPNLHIQVDMSEQRLLLMDAEISIGPDYLWTEVEPKIRAKLLERFGFEKRELGQDVHLSEIISAVEEVEGVAYMDVNIFDDLPGSILPESLEKLIDMILKPPSDGIFKPNQCVYASLARIEEEYEAKGWEDLLIIKDRYGMNDEELNERKERYKKYMLSWSNISWDDYKELKDFLRQKFGEGTYTIKNGSNDVITATKATGSSSSSISLSINSSKTGAILEFEGIEIDKFSINENYIFSWEFTEKDEAKLREFLTRNFGIDWVRTANIKKIGDKIEISASGKSLSLELNKKTEVTLKIDSYKTKFTAKKEYDALNVYELSIYLTIEKGAIISVPRTIMPAQIAFFTPYVKEMLNLRQRVSRNE